MQPRSKSWQLIDYIILWQWSLQTARIMRMILRTDCWTHSQRTGSKRLIQLHCWKAGPVPSGLLDAKRSQDLSMTEQPRRHKKEM